MTCVQNRTYDALIQASAQGFGIDPALLKAHVAVESTFVPTAVNLNDPYGGSFGLGQMSIPTARGLGFPGPFPGNPGAGTGLFDPGTNLYLAAKLIAENLQRSQGDVPSAISAYNGGWNAAKGFGYRLAGGQFGNQTYVSKVLACYQVYGGDFDSYQVSPPPEPGQSVGGTNGSTSLTVQQAGVWALALAALLALLYYVRQRMR